MAVIGVGHLGKEHARILAALPQVELVGVADVNHAQAQAVAERVGTLAFADFGPLLHLVDAACIVVPTCQHGAVASEFLKRNVHLLVEKPLALNLREADALVALAVKHKALLQVGHIERFNPAFQEVQARALQPRFIRAQRLGAFSGRCGDVGVVLDLMIHDIDLVLNLVHSPLESVEAFGVNVFGKHEDVANARLRFANGCVAELTASRASPVASRQMYVWSAEGHAILDFAERKLTWLQPSPELRAHGLDEANGPTLKDELFTRHLPTTTIDGKAKDQLTAELQDFVHCAQTGTAPRVTGADGRAAIALAERIQASLRLLRWNEVSTKKADSRSLSRAA